jgi:hypothetical protein
MLDFVVWLRPLQVLSHIYYKTCRLVHRHDGKQGTEKLTWQGSLFFLRYLD